MDINDKLLESEEIMSDPFKLLDELNKREEIANGSVVQDCDCELVSERDFLHMVTAQKETFQRYLRSQKIVPDVLDSKNHRFYYLSSVNNYIEMYGWEKITDKNRKDVFLKFISNMDMSYSYKPVFVQAVFRNANVNGEATLDSIIAFFRAFYEGRRSRGVDVEKPKNLELMADLARQLSKGFAFVRVDFYEIDGRVYFGEMTFTSSSGRDPFTPFEYDKICGEKIILPEKKPIPIEEIRKVWKK